LNHLPEVKRFLKEKGHADAYPQLKVTYIAGRTPELFIRDDKGNEIDKIDLSHMSTEEIHKLMVDKGFERSPKGVSSSEDLRRPRT
jgi:Sep15/SelM redox domain